MYFLATVDPPAHNLAEQRSQAPAACNDARQDDADDAGDEIAEREQEVQRGGVAGASSGAPSLKATRQKDNECEPAQPGQQIGESEVSEERMVLDGGT